MHPRFVRILSQPLVGVGLWVSYPVLFLYARNQNILQPRELIVPLLVCHGLLILLAALIRLRTSAWDPAWRRAGIAVFFILLYGPVSQGVAWNPVFQHNELARVFLWGLVCSVLALWITKLRVVAPKLNAALSVSGFAVVAITVFSILRVEVSRVSTLSDGEKVSEPRARATPFHAENTLTGHPNIYEIILDGYAGSETLSRIYGFDNSRMFRELEKRGFEVLPQTHSNYAQTLLSLNAVYQMRYVQDLNLAPGAPGADRAPLIQSLQNTAVHQTLRNAGYKMVAFQTSFEPTEFRNFDLHLPQTQSRSFFQSAVLELTPLPAVLRYFPEQLRDEHWYHRDRVHNALRGIGEVGSTHGPVYVTAHVTSPHPPFVFDETGNPIQPEAPYSLRDGSHYLKSPDMRHGYQKQYLGQVRYLNKLLLEAIDDILSREGRPSIILFYADHGPGSLLDWDDPDNSDIRERMQIPVAAFLPGSSRPLLYDGMTPVNLYRVIFNEYFQAEFDLLPDRSYFSTWPEPYRFFDFTDQLQTPNITGNTP